MTREEASVLELEELLVIFWETFSRWICSNVRLQLVTPASSLRVIDDILDNNATFALDGRDFLFGEVTQLCEVNLRDNLKQPQSVRRIEMVQID